ARNAPPARGARGLGPYQVPRLRGSPHAAVSSTVNLGRTVAGQAATGFANAVLRRIGGRPWDEWIAEVAPDPETDRLGYLAVAYAHPPWIVRAFAEALGAEALGAEALGGEDPQDLLAADNTPAPVHLCARPGRI